MPRKSIAAAAAIVAGAVFSCPASPALKTANATEIKVLSAVAVKSALDELAGAYERKTGDKLTIAYATAGEAVKRLQGGEGADVIILPKPRMDELGQQGKTTPGDTTNFASAAVGVAVRSGAPKPDISSPEALKRSLLAAKSISYADPAKGGASGVQFAKVLETLGIAEQVKPKTKLVPGPEAPDLVARGEAEIGVTMVPEILPVAGVDLVGPLPQELQNKTDFLYVAGILASAKEPRAAISLIGFITGPDAPPVLKSKGLNPD